MRVVLAPGWRGGEASVAPWVRGLRARGFDAGSMALPLGRAERAAARFLAVAGPHVVLGGTSFGGRAASLAAAEAEVAGLLCLAYPLRDQAAERTRHWARIRCPALIVNGEADPLTDVRELGARLPLLRHGRLELIPGAVHDLRPELDRVLDLACAFLATL